MKHYGKKEVKDLEATILSLETYFAQEPNVLAVLKAARTSFVADTELINFEKVALKKRPDKNEVPVMQNIDTGFFIKPLYEVGGDHIVFFDFKNLYDLPKYVNLVMANEDLTYRAKQRIVRNISELYQKSGYFLTDVEGHFNTDGLLAGYLHHMIKFGVPASILTHGDVTSDLFENLNMRALQSTNIDKAATFMYGEMSESGRFKFLSAGHYFPLVFSHRDNKFNPVVEKDAEPDYELGYSAFSGHPDFEKYKDRALIVRDEPYKVRHLDLLGASDFAVIASDGVFEHQNDQEKQYFGMENHQLVLPCRALDLFRKVKDASAQEIADALRKDLLKYGIQKDDMSAIIIKRKN